MVLLSETLFLGVQIVFVKRKTVSQSNTLMVLLFEYLNFKVIPSGHFGTVLSWLRGLVCMREAYMIQI